MRNTVRDPFQLMWTTHSCLYIYAFYASTILAVVDGQLRASTILHIILEEQEKMLAMQPCMHTELSIPVQDRLQSATCPRVYLAEANVIRPNHHLPLTDVFHAKRSNTVILSVDYSRA